MHRTEPTRLQSLSLQLSDKIGQLVENNERLLDLRQGGEDVVLIFKCFARCHDEELCPAVFILFLFLFSKASFGK